VLQELVDQQEPQALLELLENQDQPEQLVRQDKLGQLERLG